MSDSKTTDIPRERRIEMVLQLLVGTLAGAMEDLDEMKRAHPPSKRGSKYTRALESLEFRLSNGEADAREALS